MSNELAATPPPSRRHDMRMKLQRIRKSRRSGMFGLAEIMALGGSVVILLVVLLSYVYFLIPARSRLQERQLERSRLQNHLRTTHESMLREQDTQSIVNKITESMDHFEENRIPNRSQGRMSLYD